MFVQSLILAVAKAKFTFQIESSGDDIIFTVMPSTNAPECEGVIAQAHAALAVPLRVIVKNNNDVDESILADIQGYMQQRTSLISNLDVINKAVADATRAVKQESKEKHTASVSDSSEAVEKKASSESEPTNKSRSLEL
jgi:PRTRC genetic system protein E